jgi:hypothetical protein
MDRRARRPPAADDDEGCPRTAASVAFARDFGSVVGPDGGYLPVNSSNPKEET